MSFKGVHTLGEPYHTVHVWPPVDLTNMIAVYHVRGRFIGPLGRGTPKSGSAGIMNSVITIHALALNLNATKCTFQFTGEYWGY